MYTLRPATPDDYDFLYHLHINTIRPAVEATWGWDEGFQQQYFRERFEPTARQIIVVDNEDVGVLALEERDNHLFLALIEIAPSHQDQGLGSAIIGDLQARARREQRPLTLHVLKANRSARRLYQRLGFQIVEERDERYVMTWTTTT